MLEVPEGLRLLAERQYGLASLEQAAQWLTRAERRRLEAQRVLIPFGRNVVRFAGTRSSWRQQAMGAHLSYGPPVAVSHLAAARLLGWDGVGLPPVEVTLPHHRSGRRQGVSTHRARLPAGDVVFRHGLPTTGPARTLVDLAGRLPERHLEVLFDHLMRGQGLRSAEVLERLPAAASCPDHRLFPLHRLAELRSERPAGDSIWEDRIAMWLIAAGLPTPIRQQQVVLAHTVYLLDLAYPEEQVAVEFDGWEWHRSRRRFDHDRARTTDLTLAGWLVVQVTSAHGEAETVERVARALHQRGWRGEAMLGA